jgi:hypothetical protein
MTNFEKLTDTLMRLMLDANLGLSLPLRRMIARLTACLLEGTKLQVTALAEALPDLATGQAVKEHRIRRFLSNPRLSPRRLLPLFLDLLRPVLSRMPEIVLSLDRTAWDKRQCQMNILAVSVAMKGRAIPVFWIVWNQAGNSSFEQWKAVLTPVITELHRRSWLQGIPLVVVADREFASPRLAEWLKTTYDVDSVLRLKRSEYLCDHDQTIQLQELLHYFPRGATRCYRQITVTKASTFLLNVTIAWGDPYDEPLMIVTTLTEPGSSVARYQQRFWIEPMFKDQKSNGFDLEATRVTDAKRLETLLILSVFAHLFCSCEGERQETQGVLKKNAWRNPNSSCRTLSRRLEGVQTTTPTGYTPSISPLFTRVICLSDVSTSSLKNVRY